MKKTNWNQSWEFTLDNALDVYSAAGFQKCGEATGGAARFFEYSSWERIDLPHDWAVALPKEPDADTFSGARAKTRFHRSAAELHTNLSESFTVGWYRKSFDCPEEWRGKRIFLEFEGIFRDASFWVNGVFMDRHLSGYTGFLLEITDQLLFGEHNSVAVRVDADQPEGWWYEGAGIYRNVHLLVSEPTYIKPYETVVKATADGTVALSALLVNDTGTEVSLPILWEILDPSGISVAAKEAAITISAYAEATISERLSIPSPLLWHVDHPHLYTLRLSVGADTHEESFGFRSFRFDANEGFFLNGFLLKLNGACVHQDFGGVGVALTDNLAFYKIARLKEMGVNAYRSAHHAPSPAIVRACDELGMLLMDETRLFGASPEALRELESLVKRDRNRASVFLWSIGNEEFLIQNTERGQRFGERARRFVRSLDDTRLVTYGGNNGLHYDGINAAVDVRGVNYLRCGKIDEYHREHPDQPIVGTEETSNVLSRGGLRNDLGSNLLDATGNVTMPWGSTPKGYVKHVEQRPWYLGGFMWTGFDYRGEPSPFSYTNVSSSFGTIDLTGMEKPPFYYYKAWWQDEPVLRLLPHWNHSTEGAPVTVSTFTNCESVTLRLNGRVIGTQKVDRFDAPIWTLPFEAGVLTAEGIKNGKLYRDSLTTAGEPTELRVSSVLPARTADDVAIFELLAVDENGIPCLASSRAVALTATGGTVIGVGNGDPADYGYEQKPKKTKHFPLRTFEFEHGMYVVPPRMPNESVPAVSRATNFSRLAVEARDAMNPLFEDDVRYICTTEQRVEPPASYTFVTQFDGGEDFEYVEFERLHGDVTVFLDGVRIGDNLNGGNENKRDLKSRSNRPYRFYTAIPAGTHTLTVEALLSGGTFTAMSGYVRLGKTVEEPWTVRLHYGKARVFVKPDAEDARVELHARFSGSI